MINILKLNPTYWWGLIYLTNLNSYMQQYVPTLFRAYKNSKNMTRLFNKYHFFTVNK